MQWKRDKKKKKERTGKVAVSMVPAAAPAEQDGRPGVQRGSHAALDVNCSGS
jgi:hypothetical protein